LGELSKSLEKLTLSFFDPISAVFKPFIDASGSLAHMPYAFEAQFPNLTSLKLSGDVVVEDGLFNLFPASLTELTLHSSISFDGIRLMRQLPNSLLQLSLSTVYSCSEIDAFVFPPLLKSLELWFNSQPHGAWFIKLPRSLTSLGLLIWETETNFAVHWEDLPRGLKSYSQWGTVVTLTTEILRDDLPPNLESLVVAVDENEASFKADWLKENLPKTLKRLDLGPAVFFSADDIPRIPSYLASVKLRYSELSFALPSTVTSLTLQRGSLENSDIENLPSSLTSLNIDVINDMIAQGIARLSLLIYLDIQKGQLSSKGISHLPRSLEGLAAPASLFLTPNCFQHLPSLSRLSISSSSAVAVVTALSTPSSSLLLPKSLKRLTINTNLITEAWMLGVQHLENLEQLTITNLTPLPEQILFHLPPNLISLSARLTDFSGKESIAALPRGLSTLELSTSSPIKPLLSKGEIKLLPRFLYSLTLPAIVDESHAPELPPYLRSFKTSMGAVPWFTHKFNPWREHRPKT
jgi:hypothetical protein